MTARLPHPRLRALLGLTGAAAGLAFFAIFDAEMMIGASPPAERFISFGVLAGFAAFALLAGPLSPLRAGIGALIFGAGLGGLAAWAGSRFSGSGTSLLDRLDPTGEGLIAVPVLVLAAFGIPVLGGGLMAEGGWRRATIVLPQAWSALLRGIIALLFIALFWTLYFLSDALLSLARLEILEELLDIDPFPYVLSGAVVGIALAVTCELDTVISTLIRLIQGLLRLLIVPVSVVLTLFVAATLVEGLEEVFQGRSAAATMLGMAAASVVLVVASLSETGDAPLAQMTRWAIRILGVVLPVVCGIAIYALYLRLDAYGLSPQRLLGLVSAAIIGAFILPITLIATPARAHWHTRLRGGTLHALLFSLCLGIAWFTPLLNAQELSARDQLARLLDGRTDPEKYDFWPLARDWGPAGTSALAAYEAAQPLPEPIARKIAAARTSESRWAARRRPETFMDAWDEFAARVPTLPQGAVMPDAETIRENTLQRLAIVWMSGECRAENAEPRDLSRCIALQDDFLTGRAGPEWLLMQQHRPGIRPSLWLFYLDDDARWTLADGFSIPPIPADTDLVARITEGRYSWTAPQVRGLQFGNLRLLPLNENGK